MALLQKDKDLPVRQTPVSQQPQDDESAELFLKVLPGAGEGVHSPHLSGNFADVAHHQAAPLGSG